MLAYAFSVLRTFLTSAAFSNADTLVKNLRSSKRMASRSELDTGVFSGKASTAYFSNSGTYARSSGG